MCMQGAGDCTSGTEFSDRVRDERLRWLGHACTNEGYGVHTKHARTSGVARIFQHVPKARERSDQVGENEGWGHLHGL